MSQSHNVVVDPAFRGIAGNMTGFQVWRIEDMQVVAIPSEAWGKFFTGDAYIIFASSALGSAAGPGQGKAAIHNGKVEQHIHFWLGEEASTDEAAIAAYKSVELDEHLAGAAIQHREVQGQESKRFQAYFKKGLRYLSGGVKTGLSHYVEDKNPKLFHVKGRRKPIVRQCMEISWAVMNRGDSYVLDVPLSNKVLIWRGANSNRFEHLQAAKFADNLKTEHGYPDIETVTLDDGDEGLGSEDGDLLDSLLPLAGKTAIQEASVAPDEEDGQARGKLKLYRCSDDSGKLILTEVKDGPLLQEDLTSDDSYLIDNGNFGIWVWIGKRASEGERREAMRNAQGFIKAKGLKPGTNITRVIDGGEPAEFKTLFKRWKDVGEVTSLKKMSYAGPGRGVAKTVQTRFDAKTMVDNPKVSASTGMVDDGTGVKEVFRVEMFDLVEVPEEQHGVFFAGDCYVILYAYSDGKKDCYIIYYWLGSNSSQDEQGAAALRTIELDQRLGGTPVQVRVVQGKEPTHFTAMFGGKMTVFQGGHASSFDGEEGQDVGIPQSYLLQVRGTSQLTCKAIQEKFSASSLNTNDCFVLVNPDQVTVWFGKGSTGDEREMAKALAITKNPEPELMFEGQEKGSFWSDLGGKQEYFTDLVSRQEEDDAEPRLFQLSSASGNITVEEVVDFSQEDLIEEDVMILDAGHSVFAWFGALSTRQEQQESVRISREYLESCPNDRDVDTPVIKIRMGLEPPNFTGFFGSWDEERWDPEVLYANQEEEPLEQVMSNGHDGEGAVGGGSAFYSYAILSAGIEQLPENVDPGKREEFLTDAEFLEVLGMDREAWAQLPGWKQIAAKRAKNLF